MDSKEMVNIVSEVLEKSLPEMVGKIIDAKFEEKGLNRIEKKIFGGKKEIEGLEGSEKVAKFIKAVYNKDKETCEAIVGKALNETTNNQGGYLVPDEFRSEVVRLAEDFGLVRKLARVIPMKRDTLNLPKISSSVSVYWPGEQGAGTASQPVLGQVQLLAKTLVGLCPLSNELLEDADIDTVELLVELFAEAIAGEEDNQGLVGNGSPFTGVMSDSNVTAVVMGTGKSDFDDVTADDLRDAIAQVKPLALIGAAFFMHRAVWAIVQKLKDKNDQYICSVGSPVVSGDASKGTGIVGYIWGYPVYLSEKMPSNSAGETKFILFGNLRHTYFGDRKQMSMVVSQEATIGEVNLFESNMSAVRLIERIGFVVALASAFATIKTSAVVPS